MFATIIARLTFLEAMRRRILLAAFLLGLAFLVLYGVGFYFMVNEVATQVRGGPLTSVYRQGMFNFLALAGTYAVSFLAMAMGAILAADTLAGEIGSGAIQALVAKPLRREEIVLGKWMAFAGLLALYLALMMGGVTLISFVMSGYVLPNLLNGVALIYLQALLFMSITMMCSSTLPTLATGGVVFGLYGIAFLGGWVEQFGALFQNQTAINVGIVSSLLLPTEALLRRAMSEMTPPIASALGGASFNGPFTTLSTPSDTMIVYAMVYTAVAFWVTARQFKKRDL